MSDILNKIWSNDSIINDQYTKGLIENSIANPDQPVNYTEAELLNKNQSQSSTTDLIALFFEKIGLTLGLLVPGLRGRIIEAFNTVETLKKSAYDAHEQGLKNLGEYQKGIKNLRDKEVTLELDKLDVEIAKIDQNSQEIVSSKQNKNQQLDTKRRELSELQNQKEDIPDRLELIDAYLAKKQVLEKHLNQKLASRSVFSATTDAEVYAEVKQEQPFLEFAEIEKKLNDKQMPSTDLEEYKNKLIQAALNLPNEEGSLTQDISSLENEITLLDTQLTRLLEANKNLQQKKENLSEWLSVKPQTKVNPVEVQRDEATEVRIESKEPNINVDHEDAQAVAKTGMNPTKLSESEKIFSDIKDFIHEDLETVWRGLFSKFDPSTVKSWNCDANGNFKLELNQPMRVWIPSKDENGKQDPSSGVVLLLGIDDQGKETSTVTGKLDRDNKNMKFDKGFNLFVKPDNRNANPGYINFTNIQYNAQDDIRIITNKDLKKDYGWFLLPLVSALAKNYGTVDNNYNLIVNKQRTLGNMVENWNQEAKPVANERKALGL